MPGVTQPLLGRRSGSQCCHCWDLGSVPVPPPGVCPARPLGLLSVGSCCLPLPGTPPPLKARHKGQGLDGVPGPVAGSGLSCVPIAPDACCELTVPRGFPGAVMQLSQDLVGRTARLHCWVDLTAVCHRGAEQASPSSVCCCGQPLTSHRFCGQGLRSSGWLWARVSLEAVSHPNWAGPESVLPTLPWPERRPPDGSRPSVTSSLAGDARSLCPPLLAT